MTRHISPSQETLSDVPTYILCWRSTLAGLLITLLGFFMLGVVGAGIAGFSGEELIHRREGGMAFASATGLWLGLATVIALFCGSYFTLRLSRHVTPKAGAAHAFVLAALFFILVLLGSGSVIGGAVSGLGQAIRGAGGGLLETAGNLPVQDALNKLTSGTKLKSEAQEVARGLALRLAEGDVESAKNYLIAQSGQSPAEVEAQINQIKSDFDRGVQRAGEKVARALGDASLTLLIVMVAGLIGAVVGGRVGAHSNVERPLATSLANARGSVVPYVIGWLFGVPVSILFLIAILRSIF